MYLWRQEKFPNFSDVPLFDSRAKEKNACPGKGLAWNREFIRMICATLRYALQEYGVGIKKIAHMPVIFALHPFLQWLASGFMEHLWMKLASSNSNSASIFLCKISQTGISPASIRPFEF